MNLENIIDDELVAMCRARNLANREQMDYCVVPRGTLFEVISLREALKQFPQIPHYHIAKYRRVA